MGAPETESPAPRWRAEDRADLENKPVQDSAAAADLKDGLPAPVPAEWAQSTAAWRAERDRADPLPPLRGGDVWQEAERAPRNRRKRAEARAVLRRHGLLKGPASQKEIDDARAGLSSAGSAAP